MNNINAALDAFRSKSAIDETSLPNSVSERQMAERFIDLTVNTSTLLRNVRVIKTDKSKGVIPKLEIGKIVSEGASSTSTPTTRTPDERSIQWDTEKYRSAFDLKTDFIEDNIERGNIRDRLLEMFTKAIANDTELAAIEGNSDLDTGDGESDENNLLGVNDGWGKILANTVPSSQRINANGRSASADLYYAMKRRIPTRYRVATPKYVWLVPSGAFDKWGYDVSKRLTSLGDTNFIANRGMGGADYVPGPWGLPLLEVPMMPEDMTYGSSGTDGSQIWLTPIKNLIYIVQRDITIEYDRKPRADAWECTIHWRVDFAVENPDLVVMAENVSVNGPDYVR